VASAATRPASMFREPGRKAPGAGLRVGWCVLEVGWIWAHILDFVTVFRLRLHPSLQVLCVNRRVLSKWRCGKRTRSRSFRPAVEQCPAEGSSPWESGSPAPGGPACYVAACSSGRVPGTHSPLGGVVTCRWIGSDANFGWKTV
jgi:hypothetical protein